MNIVSKINQPTKPRKVKSYPTCFRKKKKIAISNPQINFSLSLPEAGSTIKDTRFYTTLSD